MAKQVYINKTNDINMHSMSLAVEDIAYCNCTEEKNAFDLTKSFYYIYQDIWSSKTKFGWVK